MSSIFPSLAATAVLTICGTLPFKQTQRRSLVMPLAPLAVWSVCLSALLFFHLSHPGNHVYVGFVAFLCGVTVSASFSVRHLLQISVAACLLVGTEWIGLNAYAFDSWHGIPVVCWIAVWWTLWLQVLVHDDNTARTHTLCMAHLLQTGIATWARVQEGSSTIISNADFQVNLFTTTLCAGVVITIVSSLVRTRAQADGLRTFT